MHAVIRSYLLPGRYIDNAKDQKVAKDREESMKPKAFVFDAYGTLFDVHSAVSRHSALVGPNAARVSEIWRNKQLEYSWVRTTMGQYRNFWSLTEEALDFALSAVPDTNADAKPELMKAYETLDCYEEVPDVLAKLKEAGQKLAILSNGSPNMLESAVSSAGLDSLLDDVFSVHSLEVFKATPATYGLVTEKYGISAEEVSFQSSNRWDIAGATAFGFKCRWINRTKQPDEYRDFPPVEQLTDLRGLL